MPKCCDNYRVCREKGRCVSVKRDRCCDRYRECRERGSCCTKTTVVYVKKCKEKRQGLFKVSAQSTAVPQAYGTCGKIRQCDILGFRSSTLLLNVASDCGPCSSSGAILTIDIPAGFQGVQGAQGFQGFQGSQGSQGFQGFQGLQGNVGSQGSQGSQGNQGTQGTQGLQGSQGTQGTQGNQGSQGSQGTQGSQGNQGSQGSQGNQGSQGAPNLLAVTNGFNALALTSTSAAPVSLIQPTGLVRSTTIAANTLTSTTASAEFTVLGTITTALGESFTIDSTVNAAPIATTTSGILTSATQPFSYFLRYRLDGNYSFFLNAGDNSSSGAGVGTATLPTVANNFDILGSSTGGSTLNIASVSMNYFD